MAQHKKIFYQLGFSEVDTEKLVHWREDIEKLIAGYQEELWGINTELLERLEANSGAIYGSDHILEAKEGRATFSPWMFRPFMEVFLTSELDDCYAPATTGACVPCNGKGQVDIDEKWKTSTVKKYAEKHQRLDIYEAARTPGAPTVSVTWIKEGGEIDTDRN
jgi:hypothetical protein